MCDAPPPSLRSCRYADARHGASFSKRPYAIATGRKEKLSQTMARDLRYWTIRKSTAEVVHPSNDGSVAFGSTVTIERKGRTQTFHIVAVDGP
jgi:transcription elongation GreA/GreB family factor